MPESPGRRYAIVSPVRNEEQHIRQTLESVTSQIEPPGLWLIVDDGSTDKTAAIVREYAERAPFIELLSLDDNNLGPAKDRLMWAAEAIAFNTGLGQVDISGFDFIVKLDGDLAFGPDYFTALLDEFGQDARLGIAGGQFYSMQNGKRIKEWSPETHVRGATKMYRVACFSDIGGIEPVYAWDTLDELKAQMAGWHTRSFELPVDHLRVCASRGGQLRGIARGGLGSYLLGYHPLFIVVRSARELLSRPYVVRGGAFVVGYMSGVIRRPPRVADEKTIQYLRRQQMQRLRSMSEVRRIRSLFGER